MIIYNATKQQFLDDVMNDVIAQKIYDAVLAKMGRHTGRAEYASWNNSMQFVGKTLSDPSIPEDCGVAIEYNLPLTAKRIDLIVSGYDEADTGHANIVELKQWTELDPVYESDALVQTVTGGALRTVSHPSYQAWSYAQVLTDYNTGVQEGQIQLHPCAYLHNYVRKGAADPLFDAHYSEYLHAAPAFVAGDVQRLRGFLKQHIRRGDRQEVVRAIDSGRVRPSKSLQDSLASMLKGNTEFYLLDDQKVVYETALRLARRCSLDGKKRTYIVKGGPGTGKSVVAINLLCELTNDAQLVQYVSKNAAPRNVYQEKLRGNFKKKTIEELFISSGSFTSSPTNSVNTLVVDEAHRLTRKSGLFANKGENQIKEIINAAVCSIFFIDEHQRVHINDIGSVDEIKHYAAELGSEVYEDTLLSQFRCNGSDGYLSWIDNTLEIEDTANYTLEGIDYDFQVIDSPAEMERMVVERNGNNKARILAGYCWNWPKASKSDASRHDIQIGDYNISWNLQSSRPYAIDPESVHQAGCIHTTQGLEFDYVGVIIGPDLRYQDGHVVTDYTRRASTDQSVRGLKSMEETDPARARQLADEIIKNTYRTLMTRGMKGCYVYCCDSALGDYLRESAGRYRYATVQL